MTEGSDDARRWEDLKREFQSLMDRIRAGDAAAAEECVRRFEPEIRRAARVRLVDPRLKRMVDSLDICQSVFGRFFVHAAGGALDVERPEQLLALLVTMTRNRVTDLAREQQAAKRDYRRRTDVASQFGRLPSPSPGPASAVAAAELLEEIRRRLSPDERDLMARRQAGDSWQQIAADSDQSPDALRKRLERAVERVRQELVPE